MFGCNFGGFEFAGLVVLLLCSGFGVLVGSLWCLGCCVLFLLVWLDFLVFRSRMDARVFRVWYFGLNFCVFVFVVWVFSGV